MFISLISAFDNKYTIGKNNKLPWSINEDIKWFKKNTINKSVIMGRKTFDSIGKPLVKRKNIVISRKKKLIIKI